MSNIAALNQRYIAEIENLQKKAQGLAQQVCRLRAQKLSADDSVQKERQAAESQIQLYINKLEGLRNYVLKTSADGFSPTTGEICALGSGSKALLKDIDSFSETLKAEGKLLQQKCASGLLQTCQQPTRPVGQLTCKCWCPGCIPTSNQLMMPSVAAETVRNSVNSVNMSRTECRSCCAQCSPMENSQMQTAIDRPLVSCPASMMTKTPDTVTSMNHQCKPSKLASTPCVTFCSDQSRLPPPPPSSPTRKPKLKKRPESSCGPCKPCNPNRPCTPGFSCHTCPCSPCKSQSPCKPCPPTSSACCPCKPSALCRPCRPASAPRGPSCNSHSQVCIDVNPTKNFLSVVPNNLGRKAANINVLCQEIWKCSQSYDCCVTGTTYGCSSFVRVVEIHPTGKFIKLMNTSGTKSEELGDHFLIQQQLDGWPLSVFKFPERVHFPAQSTIKIWSNHSDPGMYKPPTDYVFHQLLRWSVGANICTLLCQPCGKIVSWVAGCNMICNSSCCKDKACKKCCCKKSSAQPPSACHKQSPCCKSVKPQCHNMSC